MTPNNYVNSKPPHFPSSDHEDHLHQPNLLDSNTCQAASSSSYIITRDFFNSATNQDQSEYLYQQLQQPQFQQDQAENLASQGGSCETENEISDNGLKFCIWKKEKKYEETSHYQVKWMSSKTTKKKELLVSTTTNTTVLSIKVDPDHQKQQPSSPIETENTSNTSSNSNMSPIRVCSDCNTTKTPLWRSGPQGPKSLCNACGIRQRKARRAIAAAAAVNGTALEIKTRPPLVLKTKKYNKTKTRQEKDKISSSCGLLRARVANFKNRICNLNTTDNVEPQKKLCFEDFLLNLTNNLDYHQVFPQDEKDAAILLMALSWDHQTYH